MAADTVEAHDDAPNPEVPRPCDLCGGPPTNDPEIFALVVDSSFIHSTDQRFDGQRFLVACGRVHLAVLVERYRRRPFIEEELWAGQVARAATWLSRLRTPYDLESLAQAAGVTQEELLRAARWTVDQGERQPEHELFLRLAQDDGTVRVGPAPVCWPNPRATGDEPDPGLPEQGLEPIRPGAALLQ
ncbi:hypothetical protein E6W39_11705 [Kitasatospora acidiphila]|uniref:Uncharacterized protein n=1 Tax=Kitasatospora acidiphila TaxID=2567942 RepID=A0A540W1A4_9ACTN|nr:hypothetical protein [Kitasatospora acidiphila]TQF02800.1 hypothetical protein E6W39_11705 [Kitasatospora acidiphila]